MIKKLNEKRTIGFSMWGYCFYIAAQFYPVSYTLIPSAIIVGLCAAPLWASKCTYLTHVSACISYFLYFIICSSLTITKFIILIQIYLHKLINEQLDCQEICKDNWWRSRSSCHKIFWYILLLLSKFINLGKFNFCYRWEYFKFIYSSLHWITCSSLLNIYCY